MWILAIPLFKNGSHICSLPGRWNLSSCQRFIEDSRERQRERERGEGVEVTEREGVENLENWKGGRKCRIKNGKEMRKWKKEMIMKEREIIGREASKVREDGKLREKIKIRIELGGWEGRLRKMGK